MSAPDHDLIVSLMTTEAQQVALQQANIVSKVIDVLTEVANDVQKPVYGTYAEGRRDGQVELVKRLHALIKAERERG